MCYGPTCLAYLLCAVLFGFLFVIYFSLRYRKIFLEKNLNLTADQVWEGVAKRADQKNLKRSDLIFSIRQDGSASEIVLVIKNDQNELVGRIVCPVGSREYRMWVGKDTYRINFLLSGLRSAHLNPEANDFVLASYKTLNVFGKHQFDIPGYGILTSERSSFNWRVNFNYRVSKKLIGTNQGISPTREIGRVLVLPSEIPLHLRIFMLAI